MRAGLGAACSEGRFCTDPPTQPRAGVPGLPRSLAADPALNNQLSHRTPGVWVPSALETNLFGSATRSHLPPSAPSGLRGTFLKIILRVMSKQRGLVWVLLSLLRNEEGSWDKYQLDPTVVAGDTKEGQDRRAAHSRGPPPSDPTVLLFVYSVVAACLTVSVV